jgi:hypothetical protein
VLRRVGGAEVLPSLEQKHAMQRILAETRGERSSGGATADDDRVILLFNHAGVTFTACATAIVRRIEPYHVSDGRKKASPAWELSMNGGASI